VCNLDEMASIERHERQGEPDFLGVNPICMQPCQYELAPCKDHKTCKRVLGRGLSIWLKLEQYLISLLKLSVQPMLVCVYLDSVLSCRQMLLDHLSVQVSAIDQLLDKSVVTCR
jgi:hypothetical protein